MLATRSDISFRCTPTRPNSGDGIRKSTPYFSGTIETVPSSRNCLGSVGEISIELVIVGGGNDNPCPRERHVTHIQHVQPTIRRPDKPTHIILLHSSIRLLLRLGYQHYCRILVDGCVHAHPYA